MKPKTYKPVCLIILDGWGLAPKGPGNAIELAETPFFDILWATYPRTQLKASGKAVGLSEGEIGTSEVGHLNIGAGRIVWQDVSKINYAIQEWTFFKNSALVEAAQQTKSKESKLHLMGLVGGGTVHSSLEHLFAILKIAKQQGLGSEQVELHIFTDGRDCFPKSALKYIKQLQKEMKKLGIGKIASITGRYYAMDRDRRWERTEQTYRTLTSGEGEKAKTPEEAVNKAYSRGETDEFIKPTIIEESYEPIRDNDSIVFFNFRSDRARQLTKAFVLPEFQYFQRDAYLENIFFASLVEYEKDIPVSASAFTQHNIKANLTQVVSQQGKKQFHIAESEKYAYVTYYFSGGIETVFKGEHRVVIPSPKVSTYDKAPKMAAAEIASEVEKRIETGNYDFILVNLANPDMLGHTGIIPTAIESIETTDLALKRIVNAVNRENGVCLITADHGNAEEMIDPITGEVSTSHSNNRVPFIIAGPRSDFKFGGLQGGILADVAPTVLKLMGIPKPSLMTGKSLI